MFGIQPPWPLSGQSHSSAGCVPNVKLFLEPQLSCSRCTRVACRGLAGVYAMPLPGMRCIACVRQLLLISAAATVFTCGAAACCVAPASGGSCSSLNPAPPPLRTTPACSRRCKELIAAAFDRSVDGGRGSPLLNSRLHDFGFRRGPRPLI